MFHKVGIASIKSGEARSVLLNSKNGSQSWFQFAIASRCDTTVEELKSRLPLVVDRELQAKLDKVWVTTVRLLHTMVFLGSAGYRYCCYFLPVFNIMRIAFPPSIDPMQKCQTRIGKVFESVLYSGGDISMRSFKNQQKQYLCRTPFFSNAGKQQRIHAVLLDVMANAVRH